MNKSCLVSPTVCTFNTSLLFTGSQPTSASFNPAGDFGNQILTLVRRAVISIYMKSTLQALVLTRGVSLYETYDSHSTRVKGAADVPCCPNMWRNVWTIPKESGFITVKFINKSQSGFWRGLQPDCEYGLGSSRQLSPQARWSRIHRQGGESLPYKKKLKFIYSLAWSSGPTIK